MDHEYELGFRPNSEVLAKRNQTIAMSYCHYDQPESETIHACFYTIGIISVVENHQFTTAGNITMTNGCYNQPQPTMNQPQTRPLNDHDMAVIHL